MVEKSWWRSDGGTVMVEQEQGHSGTVMVEQ